MQCNFEFKSIYLTTHRRLTSLYKYMTAQYGKEVLDKIVVKYYFDATS